MPTTVFYSWQSDSPSKTNRNFVEISLEKAIKKIRNEAEIWIPDRESDILLDKDTKGIPGIPPIADVIFQKKTGQAFRKHYIC